MNKKENDFYKKLRKQISDWFEKRPDISPRTKDVILLAPDIFYLITKLAIDPEVPRDKKIKLGIVIAYFISPIDLLPEIFLGPLGYTDDVALAIYVLNQLVNEIDPQIIRKYWNGDQDILLFIKNFIANADNILGSGLWKKIKQKLK